MKATFSLTSLNGYDLTKLTSFDHPLDRLRTPHLTVAVKNGNVHCDRAQPRDLVQDDVLEPRALGRFDVLGVEAVRIADAENRILDAVDEAVQGLIALTYPCPYSVLGQVPRSAPERCAAALEAIAAIACYELPSFSFVFPSQCRYLLPFFTRSNQGFKSSQSCFRLFRTHHPVD